jgi:uncharacterized OB-fold protein
MFLYPSIETPKTKCLSCGSEDTLNRVKVVDRGDGNVSYALSLQTYESPQAMLFKGTHSAEVFARVCARCGYVMLFTNPMDVQELKKGTI